MQLKITATALIEVPEGASLTFGHDGSGVGLVVKGIEYKPMIALEPQIGPAIVTDAQFTACGMTLTDYVDPTGVEVSVATGDAIDQYVQARDKADKERS